MLIDSYAEQALVGAMLIDEDCCKAMLAKMRPDDFGSQWYRQAFEFMAAMAAEAVPIDPVTVAERFEDREFAGQLLIKAMEATPTAANADEYADLVKKNAARRRLSMIGEKLAECSPDFRADAVEGLAALQGVLDETTSAEVVSTAVWADSFLDEELEIIQDPTSAYCSTGWSDLDKLLGGGLFRAGFYVLGARPGMGKTTVALNIAEQVASRGAPVLFVSLEMNKRQVMCKRLAAWTSLPYRDLISGHLDWTHQIEMEEGLQILKNRPFYINNRFGLTVSDISAMVRQVRDCKLLVIDYFGLIAVEGDAKGRYEDYTAISGRLKQLACQLNIPILCLAQLNREVEKRTKKRPGLSDLRDTGAIEQDADGIIFLHREGYYDDQDSGSDIELILAKNRHGNTGTVRMYWDGSTSLVAAYSDRKE